MNNIQVVFTGIVPGMLIAARMAAAACGCPVSGGSHPISAGGRNEAAEPAQISEMIFAGNQDSAFENATVRTSQTDTFVQVGEDPDTTILWPLVNVGRFTVPGAGIDVALGNGSESDGAINQAIADRPDYACYAKDADGTAFIADHVDQGFAGLRSCAPGETGTITWTDSGLTEDYLCVGTALGWNDGYTIKLFDGTPVGEAWTDGFYTYTCNGDWEHIFIAMWASRDDYESEEQIQTVSENEITTIEQETLTGSEEETLLP